LKKLFKIPIKEHASLWLGHKNYPIVRDEEPTLLALKGTENKTLTKL
jgi:hypothetical protein